MPEFEPRFSGFEAKVRSSFERQRIMSLLGARLGRVEPGLVEIELPFREDLCQQHGFFHAGVTTTIADSAGGYAALTLMPEHASILSVEFKVNLVAPADGELLVARGRVLKPGRRLFFCEMDARIHKQGAQRSCLFGLQTNMLLETDPAGLPPG